MIDVRPRQDELVERLNKLAADAGYACTDVGLLMETLLSVTRCASCEQEFYRFEVRPLIPTKTGFLYLCGGCAAKERNS